MAKTIFLLCALASIACAFVLLRGWRRTRARFLMWSGLCFTMLAINNLLLFIDRVVLPSVSGVLGLEFGTWRGLVALVGLLMLLWGIVFDASPRPAPAGPRQPGAPMTETDFNFFLTGTLAMGAATVGLFFTRFYRDTRDRLFLAFATAFFLLSANWVALAIVQAENENRPLLYILRVLAFAVILLGIWDKNRAAHAPPKSP